MVKEEYVLIGEEQGNISSHNSLKEAIAQYKEMKKQDKRFDIEDKYFIEKQTYINGRCLNKNNEIVWKEK